MTGKLVGSKLRTDHVGSLRPRALVEAFLRRGRREIGEGELCRAEDEAIRGVVAKQEAHGLPVVTDGEYRRLNCQVSFLKYPESRGPGETPLTQGEDAVVSFRTPASARLRPVKSFPLEELTFLKSVARHPVKTTLMGRTGCARCATSKPRMLSMQAPTSSSPTSSRSSAGWSTGW